MDEKNEKNVLKDFLSNIEELHVNALSVAKELTADGTPKITVNLEKKRAMPERMESPPRSHQFYDVPSFVAFVRANKTPGTLVMANIKATKIEAVLDDRAEKGFEVVTLRPALHPSFEMLEAILNEKMPAMDFAEAMMRNREILGETLVEGKQLALLWQQLTVSSKIEAAVGCAKTSVNGVMCTTTVKGGVGQNVVELPDDIAVNVPLFINRPVRSFSLIITVLAGQHGNVLISADAPEIEVLKYQEIQAMAEEVKKALAGEVQVAVGTLATGSWSYNK